MGDRRFVGGFLLVIQLMVVMFGVGWVCDRWPWVSPVLTVLSIIIVIWLVRKYDNPTYKISWIIVILMLPLFGGLFYLIWGNSPLNRARSRHKYEPARVDFRNFGMEPVADELSVSAPDYASLEKYIRSLDGMPAWKNTETRYFPCGEVMFDSMCEELRKAEKFVFLEYFIIEEGIMWNTILDILKEKVARGVDVRVLYDDVGSITTLPRSYADYLRSQGIRATRFNCFVPTLNTYLNYRNHRKIMIIDGNVSYMGGINLADEYINKKVRFGYWKDSGIMLRGEGTASMTLMFLQMWEYATGTPVPALDKYLPNVSVPCQGYVQPFDDSPLDDMNVGESCYLQLIHKAKRYVYITTPYLVLDNEMITALTLAAQSGIDVRILTPGVPDKKLVYLITRSYYQQLFRAGVKIYEYAPGFLHAKSIVVDDRICIVGTINMDFRSFFLHFECATVFYGCSIIRDLKNDILAMINSSRKINAEWLRKVPWLQSITASILRLFAPLL